MSPARKKTTPLMPRKMVAQKCENIERLIKHSKKHLKDLRSITNRKGIGKKEKESNEKLIIRHTNEVKRLAKTRSNLWYHSLLSYYSPNPQTTPPRKLTYGRHIQAHKPEFHSENPFSVLMKLDESFELLNLKRASRKVRKQRRQLVSKGKSIKTSWGLFEQYLSSEPTTQQFVYDKTPIASTETKTYFPADPLVAKTAPIQEQPHPHVKKSASSEERHKIRMASPSPILDSFASVHVWGNYVPSTRRRDSLDVGEAASTISSAFDYLETGFTPAASFNSPQFEVDDNTEALDSESYRNRSALSTFESLFASSTFESLAALSTFECLRTLMKQNSSRGYSNGSNMTMCPCQRLVFRGDYGFGRHPNTKHKRYPHTHSKLGTCRVKNKIVEESEGHTPRPKMNRERRERSNSTHAEFKTAESSDDETRFPHWATPNQFGREDLAFWKAGAGRNKSWRLLRTSGQDCRKRVKSLNKTVLGQHLDDDFLRMVPKTASVRSFQRPEPQDSADINHVPLGILPLATDLDELSCSWRVDAFRGDSKDEFERHHTRRRATLRIRVPQMPNIDPLPYSNARSSKQIYVPTVGRRGVLQVQAVCSLLPVTLLKTTAVTFSTNFANMKRRKKAKLRLHDRIKEDEASISDPDSNLVHVENSESESTRSALLRRFRFKHKVEVVLVENHLHDIFIVEDLEREYFNLFGVKGTAGTDLPSVDLVIGKLNLRPVAQSCSKTDGPWQHVIVGRKLEQPSPFDRYKFGSIAERMSRYSNEFPELGQEPGYANWHDGDSTFLAYVMLKGQPEFVAPKNVLSRSLRPTLTIFSDLTFKNLKEKEASRRRQDKQRRKRTRKRAEKQWSRELTVVA